MEFYENLRAARKTKGFTQLQVAEQLGVTKSAYNAYESGKRQPDVPKIKMLAKILDVSGDFLLGREEEQKEKPSAENSEELLDLELIERLTSLTPEELARVDAFVQGLLASR